MKKIIAISLLTLLSIKAPAAIVFQYPVTSGALIPSSWVFPEGSDSDIYSYDKFTVGATASITDVDWIGGYIHNAQWGRVNDFSHKCNETDILIGKSDEVPKVCIQY